MKDQIKVKSRVNDVSESRRVQPNNPMLHSFKRAGYRRRKKKNDNSELKSSANKSKKTDFGGYMDRKYCRWKVKKRSTKNFFSWIWEYVLVFSVIVV